MDDFKKDKDGKEMCFIKGEWVYRECTSCGGEGHTYMNCPNGGLFELFQLSLGNPVGAVSEERTQEIIDRRFGNEK